MASGPDFDSHHAPPWQKEGYPHIWMPYCQMKTSPLPVPVVATEGVHLILADGRRLIDGLGSWWSACHGYNHPRIIGAMEEQLRKMPHVMFGGINHEPALRLAARLANLLPGDLNRVFFSDSGSVAVEVAMKMAVQFWLNRGDRGRTRFISFRHGYHGDTTGAMSVCDPVNGMHAHFQGFLMEQFCRAVPQSGEELSQLDKFMLDHRDSIAALIIEPLIQGAGGMRFHSAETLASMRELCSAHNILFIADEIATGFCRTGTMFACEQAKIVPDIICLGKGLTGGAIGMAATIASDEVFDAFQSDDPMHALMHGPTYMANPLACAAANASLDLFESQPRLQQVAEIEAALTRELEPCRDLPGVVDVRVRGAVGVVQVERLDRPDWLRNRFVEDGVWIRPFGDVIYVTPPLVISPDDLETLARSLCNSVTTAGFML